MPKNYIYCFSTCDYGWFECAEPYVCGVRQCEEGRIQKVTGLNDKNYETTVVGSDDISDLYTTGLFTHVLLVLSILALTRELTYNTIQGSRFP